MRQTLGNAHRGPHSRLETGPALACLLAACETTYKSRGATTNRYPGFQVLTDSCSRR